LDGAQGTTLANIMLMEVHPTFPLRGLKFTISIHIFHVFPLIEVHGSTKTIFSVEKVDVVFSNSNFN
jgi:hypothetical protein